MNRFCKSVSRKVFTTALLVLTLSCWSQVHASGNLNVLLGFKAMEKTDWEPVEMQGEGGIMLDFKGENWPISVALDFLGSYAEDTGTFFVPGSGNVTAEWEGRTSEFNGGIRKYWGEKSIMRPYIGGGLAFIGAWLEAQTGRFDYVRDSDYGVGLWLNGGVIWTLNKHFNIGFDVRVTGAEVTVFDQTRKAGGFHSGLILGYRW